MGGGGASQEKEQRGLRKPPDNESKKAGLVTKNGSGRCAQQQTKKRVKTLEATAGGRRAFFPLPAGSCRDVYRALAALLRSFRA